MVDDSDVRIGDLMRHYQSGGWALILNPPCDSWKGGYPWRFVDILWLDDNTTHRYDRCGAEWVMKSFERVTRLEKSKTSISVACKEG